jgi:hypothetical protein
MRRMPLKHVPDKWLPVVRQGHAQKQSMSRKSGYRFSERAMRKIINAAPGGEWF